MLFLISSLLHLLCLMSLLHPPLFRTLMIWLFLYDEINVFVLNILLLFSFLFSNNHVSLCLYFFACTMSSISISSSLSRLCLHLDGNLLWVRKWVALHKNWTSELTTLPPGNQTIGYHWVYTVNYLLDGFGKHFNALLVTKGFTQTYGVEYPETLLQGDLFPDVSQY